MINRHLIVCSLKLPVRIGAAEMGLWRVEPARFRNNMSQTRSDPMAHVSQD